MNIIVSIAMLNKWHDDLAGLRAHISSSWSARLSSGDKIAPMFST